MEGGEGKCCQGDMRGGCCGNKDTLQMGDGRIEKRWTGCDSQ